MKTSEIGLFFGSSTGNCETITRMIAECFTPYTVDIYDVINSPVNEIKKYNKLIFGIPSWSAHPAYDDWNDFLPKISQLNFCNIKIALYGLGDQVAYSENFVDAMGLMYDWLIVRDAKIVGSWPTDGYHFRRSAAIRHGKFVGLALDEDKQFKLTYSRVEKWVRNLKDEFGI